jgi:superfamily I DNA/RNA helicase
MLTGVWIFCVLQGINGIPMPLKPIILQGEQKRVLFLQVTDPIQIKGVAGSGKTTVALYRAKHLLETQSNLFQEAKVAIFTYNKILVKYIKAITPFIPGGYQKESELIKPSRPGLNVTITNFHKWAYHFLKANGTNLFGKTIRNDAQLLIIESLKIKHKKFGSNLTKKKAEFFLEEISWMKGKIFSSKEEYIDAKRTGRGTTDRVSRIDKETLWKICTDYNFQLKSTGQVDFDDYALLSIGVIQSVRGFKAPFTHIIIDEAQDLNKAQIIVLSKIVSDETKSISIIADAAQRIYKSGFTWSEVGLNVRGRTIEFKINYRNTRQIAQAAISLLSKETDNEDFTEIKETRRSGSKPIAAYFKNWNDQVKYLIDKLNNLKLTNHLDSTVILHRSHSGVRNIKTLLESYQFNFQELLNADDIDFESDSIKLCTLSSIKGLEFDNVFIVDLNDDVIPYPPGFNDDTDEYHISTERRLLYTAMTRARENLFMLASGKPSRYLFEIEKDLLDIFGRSDSAYSKTPVDDLPF